MVMDDNGTTRRTVLGGAAAAAWLAELKANGPGIGG